MSIFCCVVVLFLTERLPLDLSALLGLLALMLSGLLTPKEAFSAFSSDVVILLVASFFVSGALRLTGVGERLGQRLVRISGDSELRCVAIVVFVSAAVSSIMNNVAATAVMLPAVGGISKRTGISPSRLFLPLSFGVLLGGMTTLIGTSPNMLASEVLRQEGFEPFHFLDFSPIGILLVIFGGIYIVFWGRHFLPGKRKEDHQDRNQNLADLYRLHERMFALKIPHNSRLSGYTLKSIHFAEVLGAEVMAIKRKGATILMPGANDSILEDDTLIVRGRLGELQALFRVHGARVEPVTAIEKKGVSIPIIGVNIKVTKQFLTQGKTLKDMNFRAITGFHVISVDRNDELLHNRVPHIQLQEGDILRTVGSVAALEALKKRKAGFEIVKTVDVSAMSSEAVFLLTLPEKSDLEEMRIRDSRLYELLSLTVIGVIRDHDVLLGVSGDEFILSGDTLLVAGRASLAEQLAELSTLEVRNYVENVPFESAEIGFIEVVLSPRSKLIGKSLEDVSFTDRYGFRVVAIWRDADPKRTKFAKMPLDFGDALLLQGPRDRMHLFAQDPDFVLLSTEYQKPLRTEKTSWAILSLLILAGFSIFRLEPPHIAAVIAAIVAVIGGAIQMDEGYREIEWRVVLLVACLIPFGLVVERLGLAVMISRAIASNVSFLGDGAIVLSLAILSSVLSQTLDSSITVVILCPIAISLAQSLGYLPYPFVLSVAFGASVAFMAPFSSRSHLLIMGPGGYKTKDFFRIGFWLSCICFVIILFGCYLGLGKI